MKKIFEYLQTKKQVRSQNQKIENFEKIKKKNEIFQKLFTKNISSRSSHIPLTDDCFPIHHLCEKVEYLLLFGLKSQNVRRFFQSKKSEPEYYTFLRSVCKQSKSLIDGLRYINVQHDLKTDTGRGRGLIRYFLTQNCLGDVLQARVHNFP